jgi:hypothetical protein
MVGAWFCIRPPVSAGAGPMQTRLDGFAAEAHPLSRFAGGQSFDVPQHKYGAIGVGKGIDGSLKQTMKLLCVRLALRVRGR